MGVSGSQGKASGRKQGRLEDGLGFKENVAGKKWTSGSRGGCPGQGAGPVPRTSGLFAGGSDRRNSMKFAEETGKDRAEMVPVSGQGGVEEPREAVSHPGAVWRAPSTAPPP